ncbi:polysaccharide lyase family 7 protein [Altererythrobacter sp. RZ02]|uniref:Polysaccharide lyase family 7 protein n=1 Tax=Pontixanthobacter rizhaonensis TaxID=2730337 RepID=A0A848QMS3_9SPHN|nr:polysaccharide lyase family 7 protein [Pontixanthobacter rizhaonensis]NMW31983.1 polysaccharide lyase family 7 protein [Pontixanthobacter rizhaonensis]
MKCCSAIVAAFIVSSVVASVPSVAHDTSAAPSTKFDLSEWKITLPADENGDGKVDEVSVRKIQGYSHPDYFYLDAEGRMVFTAPNKAKTTKNSSNTRSELRHMLRGVNTRFKTHGPENNFAVEARKDSDKFGAVGGKLEATLRVDHVARNSGNPSSKPAYSAVVGQIHAVKYDNTRSGFGYGNEPIKIFYKKLPDHQTGSVFWTYERNLAKNDPDRTDIAYPVWGNVWTETSDPGEAGIPLGEDFSYTINVYRNTMYLKFESERLGTVRQAISLVDNIDANGNVDAADNKYSYGGDSLYFKAGLYNQCSTKADGSFWAAACAGTGDWPTDKANGDYAQASFSKLVVGPSSPQ